MATIQHICVSDRPGLKHQVGRASLIAGAGIDGDWHAGLGHRPVSLLAEEDLHSLSNGKWRPGTFSENIVCRDLPLATLGVGTRLRLGKMRF